VDWRSGELAEGLRLYRARRYFEAHEQWEMIWIRSQDPDKTFVQAMIQLAAACHHYQRANRPGTRSLLRAVLQRLDDKHRHRLEKSRIVELREDIESWLDALTPPDVVSDEPPESIRLLKTLDR
jgi:predicted metal-dependent hydrolase